MITKISGITFQPFKLFGEILQELFPGHIICRPYSGEDRIDPNTDFECFPLDIQRNGRLANLYDIGYGISKDNYLDLQRGETWIEIHFNNDTGSEVVLGLYCVGNPSAKDNDLEATNDDETEAVDDNEPKSMNDNYEFNIPITKLDDENVISTLKEFLKATFADEEILDEWITKNIMPLIY